MAVYYKNGVKYVGSAATREQQKDAKTGTQTTSTPTTTNNTATSATSRTPAASTPTTSGYVTSQPNTTSGFKSAADAINFITNQKGNWDSANQANDENGKNFAAKQATSAYTYLNNNGLSDVAEQLQNSGYADAKNINSRWQSYLKSTTESEPINPIYTENPVYKDDPNTEKVNKANTDLINKYTGAYNDLMKTNPFTTDEAKAILAKYDLSGLQAKDNEIANGGANNGGNIDSFAAANALRQQSALTNQGQMAVLNAHNAKLENIRGLLSDMGVNINRVYNQNETTEGRLFNQGETSKTNAFDRNVIASETRGYLTDGMMKYGNDLWNDDGSLKSYNVEGGYQTTINELEATLAKTTDEKQKSQILQSLRLLEMARNQKISEQGSNYGMTFKYQTSQPTYTSTNDAANRQSAENLSKNETNTVLTQQALKNQGEENVAKITGKNALDQIGAQTASQKEILSYTNPLNNNSLSEESVKKMDTIAKGINDVYKEGAGANIITIAANGNYQFNPTIDRKAYLDPVIDFVLKDKSMNENEKAQMFNSLGIGGEDINRVYTYQTNSGVVYP